MIHEFYVVFKRSWAEDSEYVLKLAQHLPFSAAILRQLRKELDASPTLKEMAAYSTIILFEGDNYYCLAKFEYEADNERHVVWATLRRYLQEAYDQWGMAGEFELANMTTRFVENGWPMPPWVPEK